MFLANHYQVWRLSLDFCCCRVLTCIPGWWFYLYRCSLLNSSCQPAKALGQTGINMCAGLIIKQMVRRFVVLRLTIVVLISDSLRWFTVSKICK
jgi:hypothetical protein